MAFESFPQVFGLLQETQIQTNDANSSTWEPLTTSAEACHLSQVIEGYVLLPRFYIHLR